MIHLAAKKATNKAQFLPRLGAFLIDVILLNIVISLLTSVFGGYNYSSDSYGLPMSLIMFAYFIYMDVAKGQTLGKMVLKLRVVDSKTGKNLDWKGAVLRETVGRIVNSLTLGIGYLWILWDENRQGLHDKIGNSFVVTE